jgi:hypothetical protein
MEHLHKTKDTLFEKLKDPAILKKTPTQLRALRNEINEEFNLIIRHITETRRKKRTKKKKYVPPRIYLSDSSGGE